MDKPIFDSWDLEYKNPFGAITRESECRFRIRIPKDIHLDYPPGVVLFRNGFKERFLNMTKICEEKDCNVYQASFYARKLTDIPEISITATSFSLLYMHRSMKLPIFSRAV